MLNISDKLKNIYKNAPYTSEPIRKVLNLYFPAIDLTISNDKLKIDGFSLSESLCSESDLTLGSCEAAILEIDVMNVIQDLAGLEFILTQQIDNYTMPLGTYTVHSIEKKSDRTIKSIIACDAMVKADIDVSSWYNSLSFPISVQLMRASLLTYLGIAYENQTLSNDTVMLDKTIAPSSLVGRDVLKKLCEINAGFGHITRENKFKVIQLSGLGLYPSESLYPSEDLFPSESGEYVTAGYMSSDYEEYIVEPITYVKIQEDDEDLGVGAGTPGNNYVITGNYLLYGKSATELQTIVDNIFLQVKNKYYRPHNTTMIGLPYMEVGDSVTIITSNDAIESFIFKRTLTGIQALKDNISASGNQVRDQKVSLATEIQQTKSKVLKIQKNVDQLSIDMTDMEEGLQSQITLTAGQLQTQITDNYNNLNSSITQTSSSLQTQITDNKNDTNSQISQLSDNISIKVSKGDVSSQLSVESGQVTIGSNRLIIKSDYFKLDSVGKAEFSTVSSTSTTNIKGGKITSTGDTTTGSNTTTIENGKIGSTFITADIISCPNILIPVGSVNKTPAFSDHTHDTLYNSSGQTAFFSSAGNFANRNGGDLGSSTFRWGTLYATSGTINTSDRNLKHEIYDLKDVYKQLILKCRPVMFKYNDGTSDRFHTGFISQEVEEVMQELGIESQDFAGFVKSPVYSVVSEDGVFDTSSEITGYIYMLRYEEFISPIVAVIQDQEARLNDQEARINRLEQILLASKAGEQQNG